MERGSLIMDIESVFLTKSHRDNANNSPVWLHVLVPIHAGRDGFLVAQLGSREALSPASPHEEGSEPAAGPAGGAQAPGAAVTVETLERVVRTLLTRERARSQEELSEARKGILKDVSLLLEKSTSGPKQQDLLIAKLDALLGLKDGTSAAASPGRSVAAAASAAAVAAVAAPVVPLAAAWNGVLGAPLDAADHSGMGGGGGGQDTDS
jgi:hypothetical protein